MNRFFIIFLFLLTSLPAQASFLFDYGLNYSSEKDDTSGGDYEKSRTFHKLFLGASVNQAKTLYFGWNINSWSSSIKQGTAAENTYSLLEMGPRVSWFLNENRNWYLTFEWNPYAKGKREKASQSRDISGMSYGAGLGYRFRLSKQVGLGAGIHYHSVSISEEKIGSTESDVSDKVNLLMPMIELSFITK
jgi:hypothetical protein